MSVETVPAPTVEGRRVLASQTRPWGSWHVVDTGPDYQVKRLVVLPGRRLSYQTHEHRSEHWVVVRGLATCTLDGEVRVVGPGGCVDVGRGTAHRLANAEGDDLVVVEVQRGTYLGEDDIRRLSDDYGRADA